MSGLDVRPETWINPVKELPKTANNNIKNALFVGSTAELQKMLKKDENTKVKDITPEKTDTKDK